MGINDPKRTYRKKKTWCMNLKISIETPELDHRLNESFEIEIGSNQRLKILHQTILSHVKNMELRELIKKEKMYIYIEGKEPVARKSKSLAEMGVKDGDNLIVTTEMKLPFNEFSEDDDLDGPAGLFPNGNGEDGYEEQDGAPNPNPLPT
jgi:PHP family Zn ribbon phosphoesterase